MKDKTKTKGKKTSSTLFPKEVSEIEKENEKVKSAEKMKRKRDNKVLNMDTEKAPDMTRGEEENEKIEAIGKMNKKRDKGNKVSAGETVRVVKGAVLTEETVTVEGKKMKKKESKKRRHEKKSNPLVGRSVEGSLLDKHDDGSENEGLTENHGNSEATNGSETRARKSKKSKKRKQEHGVPQEIKNVLEKKENGTDDVYCISSGEEDCSKGMKKWLSEYHQSRPGLKVLQQRIDDFINAHEEKLEQERKEREAEAAKDGWTVVVHHKGRKKTTDSESGITVGSVAPAVAEKLGTSKKHKEANLEFYRFQKRESQRNEIMALQSKFEQDKKRIQQLRAARKFKPY